LRNFEASLYILKEDEGGRKKPFPTGYRPQIYLKTADVAVEITLPDNIKIAMGGDNLSCKMKLSFPLPIEQG
jgi:elongation factor Tu